MEEVCLAFDHSLSEDPEIRGNAESFIKEQINENADFYQILFNIFNSSTNTNHRKQSLIYVSSIIRENFGVIESSLQQFSEQLLEIIINTRNSDFFKFEAEIVFRIVLKIEEPWPPLQTFILLYRENQDLIFFCVYLYISCFNHPIIYRLYEDPFSEIDCEVTLLGLQHENIELKIISANHFISNIMSSNDERKLEPYQEHYKIIGELAEKSNNLDERYFNLLWCHIFEIPFKHIEPFFNLAKSFISDGKLSQNSIIILVKIMIKNWPLIDQDDLETVINLYFNALSQIEDIDYGSVIFSNLSKIDFLKSYKLFKNNISLFLEADKEEIQFKGLVLLRGFTVAFVNQINSEISQFIEVSLNLATKSNENIDWATAFICDYLDYNKLSYEDEKLLHDFTYQCIIESQDETFYYDSYLICKKLGPNPIYFDKFIEAFMSDKIQLEKAPFVFSLLVNLYSPENNLTNEKYEPFINALFDLFTKYSEAFPELYQKFDDSQDNDEEDDDEEDDDEESIKDELYMCTILRNSVSNLVLLFSISNPSKFSEIIKPVIQCFIEFSIDDEIRELGELYRTNIMHEIKNDFTEIFKINKIKMIEYLNNDYERLSKGLDIDDLLNILIEYEGDDFPATSEFVKYFVEIYEAIEKNSNKQNDLDQIVSELHSVFLPTSKWLYRIQDDESRKKFIKAFLFYLRISGRSYGLFIYSTKILKRLVKPERINSEKYNQMCLGFNKMMTDFSEQVIPKMQPSTYCQCFEGLVNLMIFFIRMKNEYAHTFLEKYIFPFYEKYTETSEIDLLILFTKMIDLKFYNPNEIDAMKQVIDNIIERGKIYLDVRPYLFNLIAKITKIEQENGSKYFQFGLETFEEVKEKPIFHKVKAYCAYFLLTCFNQDSEQFKEVINLLPSIFSVFPTINIINDLFEEIKIFIDKNENSFTKEVYELLISTLTRYLSYQENAPLVFKFNIDLHNELIEIFGKLLEVYFNKFEPGSFEELLQECLPEQPSSVQYILSLQKQ